MRESLKQRFFAKVLINPSDPDGCWEWSAAEDGRGYGQIGSGGRYGRPYKAHQVSWMIYRGDRQDMHIDHICRNRKCVNPEHLRLVTPAENHQNRGLDQKNRSGLRGVGFHKASRKWRARVGHEHLGLFDTPEEAGEVAKARRLELFTHNELDRV